MSATVEGLLGDLKTIFGSFGEEVPIVEDVQAEILEALNEAQARRRPTPRRGGFSSKQFGKGKGDIPFTRGGHKKKGKPSSKRKHLPSLKGGELFKHELDAADARRAARKGGEHAGLGGGDDRFDPAEIKRIVHSALKRHGAKKDNRDDAREAPAHRGGHSHGGGGGGQGRAPLAAGGGGHTRHNPFKRSANLGKGPRGSYHDEAGCWKCKCGNIYTRGCNCVGTGKTKDCPKGHIKKVKINKAYRTAYNNEYHAWRARQGGAVTGRLGSTRMSRV